MINLNKIKSVTNKYGYKFIYIDASSQYKFSKDYNHLKLNVYLTFNEFDKVNHYFYLIEVKNTILKVNDIDEIIKAKEMINDDIDNMIKEFNDDNIQM